MELNDAEKRLLFQVEGDYPSKVLTELYMTARYTKNLEQREAAHSVMAKLRSLSDTECMDLIQDIQKNYRPPYPAWTIGEKLAEARQKSGTERTIGLCTGSVSTGWCPGGRTQRVPDARVDLPSERVKCNENYIEYVANNLSYLCKAQPVACRGKSKI